MSVRVSLWEDEWYPVFTMETESAYEPGQFDIPNDVYARCVAAFTEFHECQLLLREIHNAREKKR